MKILFVTDSIPFEERDGVQMTASRYIRQFSKMHDITVAVVERGFHNKIERQSDFHLGDQRIPLYLISSTMPPAWQTLLGELLLIRPTFFAWRFDLEQIRKAFGSCDYDWIWVIPVGMARFAEAYKNAFDCHPKVFVSTCDAIYHAYFEQGMSVIRGREKFSWLNLSRLVRSVFLRVLEKRYLSRVDVCHVQTPKERQRLEVILGNGQKPYIVVAQTGANESLLALPYTGLPTQNILMMNHMSGGREAQALWFLSKVWPKVIARHPGAHLFIVGSPPDKGLASELKAMPQLTLRGFVPDILQAYQNMRLAVVASYQNSGIITRILDAMSAGVPVVASRETSATVDGFRHGTHGLVAGSAQEMADHISALLIQEKLCEHLSISSRAYIRQRFTWRQAFDTVADVLNSRVYGKGMGNLA